MLLYWILLPIVWPLLHILWRIEVVGKENIPRGRAHVITSNHLSDLDPVYILEAVFSWKRYTILAKQELFKNPDTTFLDPACKTGVFLREIAKRLIKGRYGHR